MQCLEICQPLYTQLDNEVKYGNDSSRDKRAERAHKLGI